MKKTNKIFKGLLLTLSSLIVAFLAISLPFKLIGDMSSAQMRGLFVTEIAVYFITFVAYVIINEKKKARLAKEKERRFQRRAKFEQAQREYYDLAA